MVSNQLIQSILASIPGSSLVADNRQILCRCPKCGDSINLSSAHFYIGPLKDDTKPLQYNCKKCEASGIVDAELLRQLSVYDYELLSEINAYNKKINDSNPGGVYKYSKAIYKLENKFITDSGISQAKLKYINNRLGLSLTYDDILANKIVLNISDLFKQNYIPKYTRAPSIMEQLDTYFIGFISYDNCYINMRRVCSEGKVYSNIDKRYINYNIYDKVDNSMRFYIPPTNIDILNPIPTDVYITEGPFDILSVKYNIANKDNSIYIAVGGKSYLGAIKFIIENLGLINIRIHLCPDGDVEDGMMYNISRYLSVFGLSIDMMRNNAIGEKDFGVPKSNIDVSITTINGIH